MLHHYYYTNQKCLDNDAILFQVLPLFKDDAEQYIVILSTLLYMLLVV